MKVFREYSLEQLHVLLDRFPRLRIAVVGDYFLDKYLDIEPAWAETSLETGLLAHQVAAVRHSPGAAGTVAANLAALGVGSIEAIGCTGDDGEGYDLRKGLAALGCGCRHLHCDPARMTPTYLKPRDRTDPTLAGEHSRYDTKNRTPTPAALETRLIRSVEELLPDVDAVIALDQVDEEDCGVVTAAVRHALADWAERFPRVVFWADSRRRIRRFRRVIVKPNQFEAVGWSAPPPDAQVPRERLAAAIGELSNETGAAVCATCGAEGMMVGADEPTWVPTVRVEGPIDTTGAGDSATAAAVAALAAGASLVEAALVGNLAASITIEQLATTGTARADQLPPRLERWLRQHSAG